MNGVKRGCSIIPPNIIQAKLFKFLFMKNLIPSSVRLEASSMCQLHCPLCPTGQGKNRLGAVGWGYLKFKNFKNFIEDNPQVLKIELSNWGEIFLNPQLKDILKYAFSKNIALTAGNGVNFNNVSSEILECLVKYRFRHLNISLDGATNKSYQVYRRGGNFQRVIENIKAINRLKEHYNSDFPKLSWQFVVMGHNEKELPKAKQMAQALKMEFLPKLNWNPLFSPVKNAEFVRKETELNVVSRDEFMKKNKRAYFSPCSQLWQTPQINWDGKLLGCCVNIWGDFGNVFTEGLAKCLQGEKYVYTKKMLMRKEKVRDDISCSQCGYYRKILKNDLEIKNLFLPPQV